MSPPELVPDRRRRWLREIGKLFARIDEACARGDYESARASSQEVVQLLALTRPLALSDAEVAADEALREDREGDPRPTSSQQRS